MQVSGWVEEEVGWEVRDCEGVGWIGSESSTMTSSDSEPRELRLRHSKETRTIKLVLLCRPGSLLSALVEHHLHA